MTSIHPHRLPFFPWWGTSLTCSVFMVAGWLQQLHPYILLCPSSVRRMWDLFPENSLMQILISFSWVICSSLNQPLRPGGCSGQTGPDWVMHESIPSIWLGAGQWPQRKVKIWFQKNGNRCWVAKPTEIHSSSHLDCPTSINILLPILISEGSVVDRIVAPKDVHPNLWKLLMPMNLFLT